MVAEPGIRRRLALRLLGLTTIGLLLPSVGWAGPFFGQFQWQYQSVERDFTVIRSDGTISNETFSRSWWLQNYEVNFANRFKNRIQLLARARFTDMSVNNRTEGQTIPEGSLRIAHPYAGFMGRYRPITTTAGIGETGLTGPETETTEPSTLEFKSRDTQLTLTGYVAPPKLPRLDLSWIRRDQERDLLPDEDTGITRNARLNYDIGRLFLHAEYGDINAKSKTTGQLFRIQNNIGGGFNFGVFASPGRQLNLRYDVSQVTRKVGDPTEDRIQTHTVGVNGNQRFSNSLSGGLNYSFRRTDGTNGSARAINQQSGALQVNYQPKRSLNFSGITGVRTLPRGGTQIAQEYLSAVAGAQGKVLPGWEGQAGFTHTTNWTPGEPTYSIDNLRLASTLDLARGLEFFGDASFSDNSNPVTRAIGNVIVASAGFRAMPRRSINIDYRYGVYRAGPSLTTITRRSRNWRLNLSWQIVSTVQFVAGLSRAGTLPDNDPDLRTHSVSLMWTPSRLVQLTGEYAKSDRVFLDTTADRLVGTEIASLRWVSGVGRAWLLNANFTVSDPGKATEARQASISLSYSFGR
jgi:hypothetical protein